MMTWPSVESQSSDGDDVGSRDFTIESGDMPEQVLSAYPHDGSDIVLF